MSFYFSTIKVRFSLGEPHEKTSMFAYRKSYQQSFIFVFTLEKGK